MRRVVLLSSSAVRETDPGLGKLDRLVRSTVPEWTVLRPSWFMQNFVGNHPVADAIRARGEIVTATGAGRVAVDAADIAAVAARALLDERSHDTHHVITGPEALSYSRDAELVAELTGRRARHVHVSADELARRLVAAGYSTEFATALAGLDESIRNGNEDYTTDTVLRVTGRPPRFLHDFLMEYRHVLDPPTVSS